MKNKIEDLRNHLFESIELLKEGKMPLDRAKAISDTAQVIVNSAKVEVDFLAVAGGKGTGFIPDTKPALTGDRPKLVARN